MDVVDFARRSRIQIVAGKGGVGKSTIAAALALMAARAGLDVLLAQLDPGGGAAAVLGRREPLGLGEAVLYPSRALDGAGGRSAGRVRAVAVAPQSALLEYLVDHGLGGLWKRLAASGAMDVVATAVPGLADILVLGKLKSMERSGAADLIVLDAPAAGHALTFLSSAGGLADAARVGPIRLQAQDVIEMLTDPARCRVVLVTLPEETPVNEVVQTAHQLEERIGIAVGPVVVNSMYPRLVGLDVDPAAAAAEEGRVLAEGHRRALRAAACFRMGRQELQAEQVARLAAALPLPRLLVPYVFSPEIGPVEASEIALGLASAVTALEGSSWDGAKPASANPC